LVTLVACLALGAASAGCTQDQPRAIGNVASTRFQTYDGPIRNDRKHPSLAGRTKDANGTTIPVALSQLTPILTEPIDLDRDGTYRLRAGPIDTSQFDPDLFGTQPPTDAADTIRVVSPLVLDGDDVVVTVEVRGLHQPYPGFRVWVY
jgi:hypothetical protein